MDPGSNVQAVNAEFERGTAWDAVMLLFGVLFVIAAFLSLYETDIWTVEDGLFLPLLTIGVAFVILNICLRIVRPKLKVTLFERQGDSLKVCPVRNLQFSGWIAEAPVTLDIADIVSIKIYDFYSQATKAGMFWICLERSNQRVIEINTDNDDTVKDAIAFFAGTLPEIDMTVDAKISA